MAALAELLSTEAAYVNDLDVLCRLRSALLSRGACDASSLDAIFANVDSLRGINSELLSSLSPPLLSALSDPPLLPALPAPPPSPHSAAAGALDRVATAFHTLAPFLLAYALFCTRAIDAPERMASLRAASPAADQACAEVEHAAGLPLGSLLIKPVQRLCKYPLLLSAVVREAPEHEGLRGAAEAIVRVVGEVNRRVREAEERKALLLVAEALGHRELITPQRSLLLSVRSTKCYGVRDASAAGIQSQLHRLDADKAARRSGATVWLCSDLLLIGRPRGAAFTLLEQSALQHTTIVSLEERGVLHLSCDSGNSYLLQIEPADARALLVAFEGARQQASQRRQMRTAPCEQELSGAEEGTECVADDGSVASLDLEEHGDDGAQSAALKSWGSRLRLRVAATAREISTGHFRLRKRHAAGASPHDDDCHSGNEEGGLPEDEQIAAPVSSLTSFTSPPPPPPPPPCSEPLPVNLLDRMRGQLFPRTPRSSRRTNSFTLTLLAHLSAITNAATSPAVISSIVVILLTALLPFIIGALVLTTMGVCCMDGESRPGMMGPYQRGYIGRRGSWLDLRRLS